MKETTTVSRQTIHFAMAGFFAVFQSGCATPHCAPEDIPTPPESNFCRISIPVSSSQGSWTTWHTRSAGKPVVLLHALNGISAKTLDLALTMEDWGYRVYIPSLYGDPIEECSAYGYNNGIAALGRLKKDERWDLDCTESAGEILQEVREVTSWIAEREGGRDLIVMGNCLTGNFPLALLEIPEVKTAVVAQPAIPIAKLHNVVLRFPQSRKKQRALGISATDWENAVEALHSDSRKRILGFHYRNDPVAPIVKFDVLHERLKQAGLADRFTAYVLSPVGQRYERQRPDWVIGGVTEESKKMTTPHSTIINPENETDLKWFRNHLRTSLREH